MKKIFCVIFMLLLPISIAESSLWNAPKEFADVENPVSVNKQSLEKGKAVYIKNCVKCHGKEGKGDGVSAGSIQKKLPDLSREMDLDSDGNLFYKIANGKFEMPPFQLILSNDEIWHVINYVRTLAK